jgi:5-methylcytosine-specific restriction endonuclease McrA
VLAEYDGIVDAKVNRKQRREIKKMYWGEEKLMAYCPDCGIQEWSKVRRFVAWMYNNQCHECKKEFANWNRLHIHHIVPRVGGGSNYLNNLIPLCYGCHMKIHEEYRIETHNKT